MAVWHLDVDSTHPGGEVASKGTTVRCLKSYVNWVQTVVRQVGLYLLALRRRNPRLVTKAVHSTQGFEWSNQWWICCGSKNEPKQISYVTNGEVLKANKYETSSKIPIDSQPTVEDDNVDR